MNKKNCRDLLECLTLTKTKNGTVKPGSKKTQSSHRSRGLNILTARLGDEMGSGNRSEKPSMMAAEVGADCPSAARLGHFVLQQECDLERMRGLGLGWLLVFPTRLITRDQGSTVPSCWVNDAAVHGTLNLGSHVPEWASGELIGGAPSSHRRRHGSQPWQRRAIAKCISNTESHGHVHN